jgi:hypothetical protein
MQSQEGREMKNSTPGRPNVRSARLPEDLSRQIDAWIAAQPEPRPSRSEAIRFALHDWFSSQSAAVKSPELPPGRTLLRRRLDLLRRE